MSVVQKLGYEANNWSLNENKATISTFVKLKKFFLRLILFENR